MRIALIADIHGNLQALEAVLAEISADGVDRIVCLGDVVSFGPQPREVTARLRALGCPVVMGNTDAEVFDPSPSEGDVAGDGQHFIDMNCWTRGLLSEDELAYLRGFQPTVSIELGGGKTLLCYHGSPRSFDDRILPETPRETFDEWLGSTPAALNAGGHTHCQMLIRHRSVLVLNPGSVGLPYATRPPAEVVHNPAWAEYAVVEVAGDRLRVDLRRTPFDVAAMLAAGRANGMPHVERWATDWDVPARA